MPTRRNRIQHRRLAGGATAVVAIAMPALAHGASYEVSTEAVVNYSYIGATNVTQAISYANAFQSGMTQAGSPFIPGLAWTDNNVFDTDFYDPERTGGVAANDTNNFDRPNRTAISVFAGHGVGDSNVNTQYCTSGTQCTNPPFGAITQGACRQALWADGLIHQYCSYDSNRQLVTSSNQSQHGNLGDYSSGLIALGETYYWGNWANAGSNGGTNLAVIDTSYTVIPPFWVRELSPMFAGVRLAAMVMPVAGDDGVYANRGSKFAELYRNNPSGEIATAWKDTMWNLGQSEGNPCGLANFSQGGGHGVNGCGCNFIMTEETNSYWANAKIHETWAQLPDDTRDPSSNAWAAWTYTCNYNSQGISWAL